ncbi:MAG: hypothetical protein C4539_19475 [Ignavibacteriales bacterium]|nr:MAG: hypothetical protein C4539_19475 [Ignavibacteriales bacterium]
MNKKFIFIIFLITLISSISNAQVVYVPLDNSVYDFLERMTVKGVINTNNEVKPYSRKYVAEKLFDVKLKTSRKRDQSAAEKLGAAYDGGKREENYLTDIDREELEFYLKDYGTEFNLQQANQNSEFRKENLPHEETNKNIKSFTGKLSIVNNQLGRWNLIEYSDSLFHFRANPIAGYGVSKTGDKSGHTQWWGANMWGTYSDWFGAQMDFRDKGEYGDNVDDKKSFTAERGYWINHRDADGIEFSDVKGGINFNWSWGSVSLIKDYNRWGHGKFGQLILSDKASSYPHIKIFLHPVEWLRFYYIHGWLTSNVPDSVYFFPSGSTRNGEPVLRKKYVDKYIAANLLTVSPWNFLDVSVGNSVIYSYPTVRPEYFIPFLLYKFQDHNAGRDNNYGNNGQLFADLQVRYPENYSFYSTLFVEMMDNTHLYEGKVFDTWIGYTLGLSRMDLLIDNLDLYFEYTRINPWVYEHYIKATDYKHIDFPLGHWLGQNADQIRVQLNYKPIPRLSISGYVERLRKGGLLDISLAYDNGEEKIYPFLYSPVRKDFNFGFEAKYEIVHDLNIKGKYCYSDITDEAGTYRTYDFMLGKKNNFSLIVYYGL